jgi:hypothetical protein
MHKFIVGVDCTERQLYTVEAPTENDADHALRRHLHRSGLCDGTSVDFYSANDSEYDFSSIRVDTVEAFDA